MALKRSFFVFKLFETLGNGPSSIGIFLFHVCLPIEGWARGRYEMIKNMLVSNSNESSGFHCSPCDSGDWDLTGRLAVDLPQVLISWVGRLQDKGKDVIMKATRLLSTH